MSKNDRIKRQIFQELVEDNLELIEGKPKGWARRRRLRRLATFKQALALCFVAALATLVVTAWRDLGASATVASPAGVTAPAASVVVRPLRSADDPPPRMTERASGTERVRHLAEILAQHQPQELLSDLAVPLAVRKVVLDPGHGGVDGGTSLGYGLTEKDLTLDIAYRLGKLLEAAGCTVVHTRTEDVDVSLKERAAIANRAHADIFISIHVNWIPRREARGVETYCLGRTDDPFVRRLVAAENRDSGFSMADYRNLLQGIFDHVRQEQSRALAEGIQQALYQTLRTENREIENRGVMTAPFVVLVATEMPAVLAEVACLSNDREARLLAIPRYRQRIAEALHNGFSSYSAALSSAAGVREKGANHE